MPELEGLLVLCSLFVDEQPNTLTEKVNYERTHISLTSELEVELRPHGSELFFEIHLCAISSIV